jgi:hypothetical protein
VTIQQADWLETPVGGKSIVIPIGEGVDGRAGIRYEKSEEGVSWRFGIGYILEQAVSIRANEHDITMLLFIIAPEPQGTKASSDTAEHMTGSQSTIQS